MSVARIATPVARMALVVASAAPFCAVAPKVADAHRAFVRAREAERRVVAEAPRMPALGVRVAPDLRPSGRALRSARHQADGRRAR